MNIKQLLLDSKSPFLRSAALRQLVIGIGCAAVATLVMRVAKDAALAEPHVLLAATVVLAAWFGGTIGGVTATVVSLVVAPFLLPQSPTPLANGTATLLLFAVEAALLIWFVVRIRRQRDEGVTRLRAADSEIARLNRRERELMLIQQAFETVSANLRDNACMLLDARGRVTRWNSGAERMFGYPENAVMGRAWPNLAGTENPSDGELRKLMDGAQQGVPAVGVGWMRRADGSFRGDVTVTALRDSAAVVHGFSVVIRDLTREEQSQEFRSQAIAAQEALQGEADALTDQLEAIQSVLDPDLSDLPVPALLKELMGRLLVALRVDGAAFIDARETHPVLISSSRGIQAQPSRGARSIPYRLRVIQNDDDRAREASVVKWGEGAALVVTVPVTREKVPIGALEVVTRKPRRWTERDAIVLLLAADRTAAVLAATPIESAASAPVSLHRH